MNAPHEGHTPPALPLVVIGGYLGAGKTTLLNHLLRHAQGRRIGVLVNDFGSVSIDAELIEGAAEGVLALAGGCVCCSFGSDLIGSLQQMARRTPRPDLLLLECSGVGLPAAVARSAALVREVHVEGVVVVADAAQLRAQSSDRFVGDTVREQLQQADLLILNHQDRCSAEAARELADGLARLLPGVPQAACARGEVAAELVLGLHAAQPATTDDATLAWPGGQARYRSAAPALPHPLRYVDRQVEQPVDPQAWARDLVAAGAGRLLRAKGILPGNDGRWWRLQIMGRRIDIQAHAGGGAHPGTVVCIEALPEAPTAQVAVPGG